MATKTLSIDEISNALKAQYDAVKYDLEKHKSFVRDLLPLFEELVLPLTAKDKAASELLGKQIERSKSPVLLPTRHLLPIGILGFIGMVGYAARGVFSPQHLKSALIPRAEWTEMVQIPYGKNLAHLFSPAAQYFREASATTIFGYDAIPLAAGVIVAAGVTLAVMNLAWFETPKTATNKTGT